MGEFLSTPNKEKESDSNENSFVTKYKLYNKHTYHSSVMVLVECKAGVREWKMLT